MYPSEDLKERMEVEWVFGLTGGELADKPLRFLGERRWESTGEGTGEWSRRWARYWYDGSPDYAPEISRRWRGDVITIVSCELFGLLPDRIYAKGKKWRKVARFVSSGETGCPEYGNLVDLMGPDRCEICEEERGSQHGYLYLGDGWSETVYVAR